MTQLHVLRWWYGWGQERERWEGMGGIIMRNWDLREYCVPVNLQSTMKQVRVLIQPVISPIHGLLIPIRPVVPLISHMPSYRPHRSHLHPPSLSFSSTTLPSSQNTKLGHYTLSLPVMIISWHQVQHTPSTTYTEYSIHRVQHPPKIDCLPFILMITSWPLTVASASGVPLNKIDWNQPALHGSSKVKLACHIPTVAS